jgi:acyl-CoA thioesterase
VSGGASAGSTRDVRVLAGSPDVRIPPGASDVRVPPGALAELLGMSGRMLEDGHCQFEVALAPQHLNPYGAVHGGIVYTLVDYAMGGAMVARLEGDERCATLEIKINYLASARDGVICAEAWVVERTKRIGVLEARVREASDRLLAMATGTFYIQRGGGT